MFWRSLDLLETDEQPQEVSQLERAEAVAGRKAEAVRVARLTRDPDVATALLEEASKELIADIPQLSALRYEVRRELLDELLALEAAPPPTNEEQPSSAQSASSEIIELIWQIDSEQDIKDLLMHVTDHLRHAGDLVRCRAFIENELRVDPDLHFYAQFDLYQHTRLPEDLARARVLGAIALGHRSEPVDFVEAVEMQLGFWEATTDPTDLETARTLAQGAQPQLARAQALKSIATRTANYDDFMAAVMALPTVASKESIKHLDLLIDGIVEARRNAEFGINVPGLPALSAAAFQSLIDHLRKVHPLCATEVEQRWFAIQAHVEADQAHSSE